MAYDDELAGRVRDLLSEEPGAAGCELGEKRMFGGLAFLVGGHMALAVSGQGGIMVRVDPAESERLLATTPAYPMVMRGRELAGWLRVTAEHLADEEALAAWVARGASYAAGLPPK